MTKRCLFLKVTELPYEYGKNGPICAIPRNYNYVNGWCRSSRGSKVWKDKHFVLAQFHYVNGPIQWHWSCPKCFRKYAKNKKAYITLEEYKKWLTGND